MARIMTLTALITLFVDQVIKYYILHVVQLERVGFLEVIPGMFNLIMTWNRGVNFGLFAGDSDATRWILIAIALGICVFVIYWMRRETNAKALFSAGLLLGGALGNVIDRVLYGGVADFLNMTCCGIQNPFSFNVADITIFLGAIGLIFFATDHKKA